MLPRIIRRMTLLPADGQSARRAAVHQQGIGSRFETGLSSLSRTLALHAGCVALLGICLGLSFDPRFYFVSAVAAGVLLSQALRGAGRPVSPPDRLGMRSPSPFENKRTGEHALRTAPGRAVPKTRWRVVQNDAHLAHGLSPSSGREPSAKDDRWTIVDERDRAVFTGSKESCEDWLDFQDNAT